MSGQIKDWLDDLGLDGYAKAFVENEIDLDAARDLTESDLRELGIPMGPRKKLLRAVAALEKERRPPTSSAPREQQSRPSGAVERRQLTVMFCDLVGSTALSRKLDPEDLRDIMRRYQDAVAGSVTRYGGHVAKYLGDGVLVYFGWPQAYEDQAERAVRAGLDAVQAVRDVRIDAGDRLAARVGIGTGQVVVGDLIGESGRDAEAVSGETPNLAARLQGVAEPGQVVIGDATRRLVGQAFAIEDLGSYALKGFDDAIQAWAIAGEVVAESRFDATHGAQLTDIVGREAELQLLLDRWRLAENSEGQAVMISGEAGIGKSRLMQGLCDQVMEEDYIRIRYQCSPYHSNSALYPAIRELERSADFASDDDGEDKLDKLVALLRQANDDIEADVPLFANLLSLPYEEHYGALTQPPQQTKERLLEALITRLVSLAEHRPVLFLFEDAHWIDPTSQELLERAIGRLQEARVLLIITHRPEWQSPFASHNHVTSLQLNRLGKAQGAEIVRAIAGDYVSDDGVERIASRADGVPLFIEELTKSLLEDELDIAEADIPATLQASLLARLDRLGQDVKSVAQVSAVLGREFAHDMLAAIIERPERTVTAALDELVQSGLIFRTDAQPGGNFVFKHALVQESAYQSLLLRHRRKLHAAAAAMLERDFHQIIDREPETAAHHFNEAGKTAKALVYWQKAGHAAARRFAVLEAERFYIRCLELIPDLSSEAERVQAELPVQLALGNTLIASRGLHLPEVYKAFDRARELSESLHQPDQRFEALFGLWVHTVNLPDLNEARPLAALLHETACTTEDPEHLMQARHATWTNKWLVGNFKMAVEHATAGGTLYDVRAHQHHKFRYGGHDPGLCGLQMRGLSLCFLGYPEQAIQCFKTAEALAADVQHPFSWVLLQFFHSIVRQIRGETKEVFELSKKAYDVALSNNVSLWSIVAGPYGWAEFMKGEHDSGLSRIREGLNSSKSIGTELFRPYLLGLFAECLMQAGNSDAAHRAIEEGFEIVSRIGGEHWYHTDLLRLRAEILMREGASDSEIEQCLTQALQAARHVDASYREIAIVNILAKIWRDQGKPSEARELLVSVYCKFTEGFDTPELVEAKLLLDELN